MENILHDEEKQMLWGQSEHIADLITQKIVELEDLIARLEELQDLLTDFYGGNLRISLELNNLLVEMFTHFFRPYPSR